MFFPLSIIRSGLLILVEMIDLVNSVIIFLSQMTLLRWLTFLHRSQTDFHSPWSCSYGFISSDAICSTVAFPPLGNFDHVVVSVSIDFLSNLQRNARFHRMHNF